MLATMALTNKNKYYHPSIFIVLVVVAVVVVVLVIVLLPSAVVVVVVICQRLKGQESHKLKHMFGKIDKRKLLYILNRILLFTYIPWKKETERRSTPTPTRGYENNRRTFVFFWFVSLLFYLKAKPQIVQKYRHTHRNTHRHTYIY